MPKCPDIPNLRHLRMLQVVGRLSSITCASQQLNASQPAVTKAISNFEQDLDAPLFERRSTGTFPTELGLLYLRRVKRFFDIIDAAVDSAIHGHADGRCAKRPPVEQLVTGTQFRSLIATVDNAAVDMTARELGVSVTSLYRSVRDLERALDLPLFVRTADGPRCNATGQELARQMLRAVREIEYGRGEVKRAIGDEDAEILVGALPISGSWELARAVSAFVESRATARVRIVNGDYWTLLNDLRHCRIDMLFGILRKPDWVTDVVEEACFSDPYCLVTRAGHPLTRESQITRADLATYDWIVPEAGTPLRQQIDRMFEGLSDKPRFCIETRSLPTMRALLFRTDLISVMSRSEVTFYENIGVLESFDCPFLKPVSPKGIATRADWLPTESHLSFLEFLRDSTARAKYVTNDSRIPPEPVASERLPT